MSWIDFRLTFGGVLFLWGWMLGTTAKAFHAGLLITNGVPLLFCFVLILLFPPILHKRNRNHKGEF